MSEVLQHEMKWKSGRQGRISEEALMTYLNIPSPHED
jgi:hypothetical protein